MRLGNEELLKRYGIEFTDELGVKLAGRTPRLSYELLAEEYGLSVSFEQFNEDRENMLKKYLTHVRLMPGTRY